VVGHSPVGYQLYEPSAAEMVVKIRELQREKRMSVREIGERVGEYSYIEVVMDVVLLINYVLRT
jgi:hypothetical protein